MVDFIYTAQELGVKVYILNCNKNIALTLLIDKDESETYSADVA